MFFGGASSSGSEIPGTFWRLVTFPHSVEEVDDGIVYGRE